METTNKKEIKAVWFPITMQEGINPQSSSARIRGRWVFDKLPWAINGKRDLYIPKQLTHIIFQKWCDTKAVNHAKELLKVNPELKVVLDMCDPTWLFKSQLTSWMDMIALCDLVTFSTESLRCAFEKTEHFKGVKTSVVIDRHDMNEIGKPKLSSEELPIVLWHGHSNNLPLLRKILLQIQKANEIIPFKLVIAPEKTDPYFNNFDMITQNLWDERTIYDLVREATIVLCPTSDFGEYAYKSDNKASMAECLGTKAIIASIKDFDWEHSLTQILQTTTLSLDHIIQKREEYNVWHSVNTWKYLLESLL